MEQARPARERLNILIGSGVPKRREGGVAAVIYNLGRELENLGHQVTYVFLDDLVAPNSVSRRFSELIYSARLSRYVQKNRDKFTVVNLHAPAGLMYGLRRKFLGRRGLPPYVMTLHGLEERRVHVMKREAKKGRAWNFGWRNAAWHSVYHFPRFRWSIRTADAAHTFSRDVWNVLQLKYDLDGERAAYIPNGVEQRFFTPRQYGGRDVVRLLYPGTWLDQRGIFYLREALTKLLARTNAWTFTIAGPGVSEQVIRNFLGAALAPKITVIETVPAEEMPTLYLQHDALVFPSLMEGLPTVLLEAMATGMPVLTTETCGMTDVVEDEINGLLIAPADAEALEEGIFRLVTSADLRQRLGMAARRSMEPYTWERSAKKLESLFYRVADRERA
jgi:glycosyltransferase involved in cell wall biosynthesis